MKKEMVVSISVVLLLTLGICFTLGCSKKQVAKEPGWIDDPAAYVDPFIGTAGEESYRRAANTVPGAVMPFGMFNFGPECSYTDDLLTTKRAKKMKDEGLRIPVSPGGYNYAASRVKGFSLTRLSGTGCLGASGDVPFLPFTDEMKHSPDNDPMNAYYSSGYTHENEQAEPGYYRVKLENGVGVELTATERTGLARFTYPGDKPAHLLVRTSYSQLGSGASYTKIEPDKGEVSGYVTSGNFCGYLGEYNRRDYYTLYFVAQLDRKIIGTGAWKNEEVKKGELEAEGNMPYGKTGIPVIGKGAGVWLTLDVDDVKTVNMRIGISYVSIENARLNLAKEQNNRDSLETVRKRAYNAWNETLTKVKVESGDEKLLKTFYTALYHTQFHPNLFSDVNGEYAGFDGEVHKVTEKQEAQYANFSGWDVYRSQLQLVTLMHPDRASDIAQSLLNQANQNNGVWDRWTHNSGPTGVMSGDPSTIAIANFVAFGANRFDVEAAYQSLEKAAKVPTALDLSPEGKPVFSRGQKPSLDQWLELNYISDSNNAWEGASETLEQASAFFALSQLAERLGKTEDHALFLKQSGYWKNLFNPKATTEMGYIQGRNKNGSWKVPFDPANPSLFVEGSPLQYLWMVPFDGEGLFSKMGGWEKAVQRLDNFFKKPDGSWALYRAGGAYSDVSNQPSINAPWMYLFAGKAYKTQETLRTILKLLWKPTVTGIPGQDDLGEMSSWYVFSTLGLYPLYPGRADLVIGSPVFTNAKIERAQGDILIKTQNNTAENIYVQNLEINGKPGMKSWIDESYIKKGIRLTFKMSNQPNPKFGGNGHVPPSFSSKK
jgi:predicted alpha-1,2-mannosidase